MNIKNPFHVVAFFVLGSVFLWLTLAFSQGFLIASVPQAPDYCVKWVEIPDDVDAPERLAGSSSRCIEFSNIIERLKYHHNLRMVKRNRVLLSAVMRLGIVISVGAFYALPKYRGIQYAHGREPLSGTILLSLILAVSPMVLGTIFPAPARWAPEWVNEYVEARRGEALVELTELAVELGTKQGNDR